jgi:pilus assembly protein FimV
MDKNKIIQAATKYVQKGQFDKAIKEYQKIIDEDPKDIRIVQKVGELHQKRGDNVQAALTFIKVAESYANDGFFLKAAAVYKQVLKLNPSLVETNFKLAELYQQLGLMSDAFQQFQLVAAAYEQQGDVQASLGILKKLTELDPENVANRIRLAESYSREGMTEESVAEFTKVAAVLKQNNRADEYIKVAERLAFLDPQNMTLCRELANVYLAKGDTKRALAKLQICFKTDPRDIETLTLLAQAFKDLGQSSKTISVYKELAKIFAEADRFDDEKAIWRKVLALAPDDQDALDWQAANGVAAPAAPVQAPVQEPSRVRARPSGHRDVGPEAVPKLLTEMDVYLKYGLHAKAAEHLKKILAVAPSNLVAHEKAKDLYLTMGDMRRAADELAIAARLAVEAGERDRAHEHLLKLEEVDPQHPDLATLAETIGADVEVAELADDAILVEASDDEFLVAADDEFHEEEPPARTNATLETPAIEEDEGFALSKRAGTRFPLWSSPTPVKGWSMNPPMPLRCRTRSTRPPRATSASGWRMTRCLSIPIPARTWWETMPPSLRRWSTWSLSPKATSMTRQPRPSTGMPSWLRPLATHLRRWLSCPGPRQVRHVDRTSHRRRSRSPKRSRPKRFRRRSRSQTKRPRARSTRTRLPASCPPRSPKPPRRFRRSPIQRSSPKPTSSSSRASGTKPPR